MRRVPIYILIECSSDMVGPPINLVLKSINGFISYMKNDPYALENVHLSVIKYGYKPAKLFKLTPLENVKKINISTYKKSNANLNNALDLLINSLQSEYIFSTSACKGDLNAICILLTLSLKDTDIYQQASILNNLPIQFLTCVINSNFKENLSLQLSKAQYDVINDDLTVKLITYYDSYIADKVESSAADNQNQTPENISANLQDLIDNTNDNEILNLNSFEILGPATISKPITIEGNGARIWSITSPVLTITSQIALNNLRVEYVNESSNNNADESAIHLEDNGSFSYDQLTVRGKIRGGLDDCSCWRYPLYLNPGKLKYGVNHSFLIHIFVPKTCRITSSVSGLEISPHILNPGKNDILLKVENVPQDTLLYGELQITTKALKRIITFRGQVVSKNDNAISHEFNNYLLWEPSDWAIIELKNCSQNDIIPQETSQHQTIPLPREEPPPQADDGYISNSINNTTTRKYTISALNPLFQKFHVPSKIQLEDVIPLSNEDVPNVETYTSLTDKEVKTLPHRTVTNFFKMALSGQNSTENNSDIFKATDPSSNNNEGEKENTKKTDTSDRIKNIISPLFMNNSSK